MAGALAVATVAMSSAAPAAFLYVPPQKPAADAAESAGVGTQAPAGELAAGGEREPASVGVVIEPAPVGAVIEPGAVALDPDIWSVRSGETLREVLSRWGTREDIEVLFLTDRRYRLHEGRAFDGSFAEASQALFSALSHLPRPPVGERRFDGRTFAVMHRARGLGDGR